MTIDEFWRKYNHCPLCRLYTVQAGACDYCKWYTPNREHDPQYLDYYDPTDSAIRAMNKEVTE